MSTKESKEIPADFRYRDVLIEGKPQHDRFDPFRIRHPSMDPGKRAKIFAPFDALRGFSEAVAAKDIVYEERRILSQEDAAELNRRLGILHRLTGSGRLARANRIEVAVTYYEPCSDEDHEYYGIRGRCRTVAGICRAVDAQVTGTLLLSAVRMPQADRTVRRMRIRLEDILQIESSAPIFRTE